MIMTNPLRGEELLKLIPQKHPFVLIDTLHETGKDYSITGFTVPKNHVLTKDGFLSEPGLIENMAQSAAAMTGYANLNQNKEPEIGFIAAIKNLEIYKLPKSGTSFKTKVTLSGQVFDFIMINGEVYHNNSIFAKCEIKVFLKS